MRRGFNSLSSHCMFEGIEDEFEAAIEAMPRERHLLAFQRACKRLNIEHRYEGATLYVEADPQEEELITAFGEELNKMVFEDALHELGEDGYLDIETNDEGQLSYKLTEKGKEEAERLLDEE